MPHSVESENSFPHLEKEEEKPGVFEDLDGMEISDSDLQIDTEDLLRMMEVLKDVPDEELLNIDEPEAFDWKTYDLVPYAENSIWACTAERPRPIPCSVSDTFTLQYDTVPKWEDFIRFPTVAKDQIDRSVVRLNSTTQVHEVYQGINIPLGIHRPPGDNGDGEILMMVHQVRDRVNHSSLRPKHVISGLKRPFHVIGITKTGVHVLPIEGRDKEGSLAVHFLNTSEIVKFHVNFLPFFNTGQESARKIVNHRWVLVVQGTSGLRKIEQRVLLCARETYPGATTTRVKGISLTHREHLKALEEATETAKKAAFELRPCPDHLERLTFMHEKNIAVRYVRSKDRSQRKTQP
jgi:hypothetical protein